jgi:lysine 2,3-aminomutase
MDIIRGLRGFTSGYAIPTYVIDAPGGGGKVPVMPDYIEGRDGDSLVIRNYEGNFYKYPAYRSEETSSGVFVPVSHAEA